MRSSRPQRIVIAGAGFGGLYTYIGLHRILHGLHEAHITLVNESDQFVFIPMLHEVATGALLPSSVTRSLRSIPQCCLNEFVHGRVTAADLDKQVLQVEYHERDTASTDEAVAHHHHSEIEYDYLVLGLGSESIFFGVPGAREYALPLKTLNDARRLKNHVIERFEEARRLDDPDAQRAELQFVIVGGGPTGVELAGELNDLFTNELARAFPELKDMPRILLIEGGESLLKTIDPWFGRRVHKKLDESERVYMMFNKRVSEVTQDGVHIGEEFVPSKTVIWSGGVRARELAISARRPLEYEERTQRIRVTKTLNTLQYKNVFVVGDLASVPDGNGEQSYPMRAQFAAREGIHTAKNIVHQMRGQSEESFSWNEQGFILSLGEGGAFAQAFGMKLSGPLAWFLYRTVYLMKTVGLRSKFRMALEWTLNLFTPRDISKL